MIVDFHSHILPGVDDGSQSVEMSITMLQMEAEQGVERVVATPHFYARKDTPENFLAKRAAAEALLREEMARHTGLPELSIGAEVRYFPGISRSEVLSELAVDKKGYVLVEMPMDPWTDRMYQDLEDIWHRQALTPIIAHVDRYIAPFRTRRIPERLAKLPVLVQANASFFLEKSTKNMALRMLRKGQIHLLGSDCHNPDKRPPNLDQAAEVICRQLGREALELVGEYAGEALGL